MISDRLRRWLRCLLVGVDQLAQTLAFGPAYLIFGGSCPSPDETISSVVGRRAIAGGRWARVAERAIDWSFERLGSAPGHCRRMIETLPPFA